MSQNIISLHCKSVSMSILSNSVLYIYSYSTPTLSFVPVCGSFFLFDFPSTHFLKSFVGIFYHCHGPLWHDWAQYLNWSSSIWTADSVWNHTWVTNLVRYNTVRSIRLHCEEFVYCFDRLVILDARGRAWTLRHFFFENYSRRVVERLNGQR